VQEGVRTFQQATQQGLETTQQVTRQGLRVAEEATEQTTRQAKLQIAVSSAFKSANYDEMSVDEISKRLDSLSAEELEQVREYEKHNKNRETLVGQIDRKKRAKNS
jgi:hypothetical protein